MPEHKFEPFQQVLVRNRNYHPWEPMHYGYAKNGEHVCSCQPYQQCIPYTPETAHFIGTKEPYTPPVDESTRFKAGEAVEVTDMNDCWCDGIYLRHKPTSSDPMCNQHRVYVLESDCLATQPPHQIRKKS